MISNIYNKLGGNIHGKMPNGGLSGIVEGGNLRSMSRTLLRNAFPYNSELKKTKLVQDASVNTRYKYLNNINNQYNALKY